MDYFYVPPDRIKGDTTTIEGEEYNHLVHVMRKKVGDTIRVVDGKGTAYDVTISGVKKRAAVGTITAKHSSHNEPAYGVTVAVGVLKNPAKFDFLVEKLTELGVREIIPITTSRTIPLRAKTDRWQKLALAAMKQCGRSFMPIVHELQPLTSVLSSAPSYQLPIICHNSGAAAQHLSSLILVRRNELASSGERGVLLLVGPEGGFSDEEFDQCVQSRFLPVSLGPRRLRTETAAICAASLFLQV